MNHLFKTILFLFSFMLFQNLEASVLDVKITEIMYHPIKDSTGVAGSQFEFIELKNTG